MTADLMPLAVAIGACTLSIVLTGWVRRFAIARNVLDVPNLRSSHRRPTPRGGGLAIALVSVGSLLLSGLFGFIAWRVALVLSASGALVALTGFLDDRRSLPARVRLAAHVAAAGLFVVAIGGIPEPWLAGFGLRFPWVGAIAVVLALTWGTNLFNFMDGIDGIAGCEAAFVAGAGFWINASQHGNPGVSLAFACLCGASVGFLFWNWSPARIFLGDVGSGYLGLMLPMLGLIVSAESAVPVQVWIILGGIFFVDATVTLLRRLVRGDRWFEAHRLHAYQHLARLWNGHSRVTLAVTGVNLLWLGPWALFAIRAPAHANASTAAALLPLVALAWYAGAGRPEGR